MKKKLIKKLLLVVIMAMLCLVVGMMASASFWLDQGDNISLPSFHENGFTYKVSNDKAFITSFDCRYSTETLRIPETLGGYPVVCITENAASHYYFDTYQYCDNLAKIRRIELPDTDSLSMEYGAFAALPNLEIIDVGKCSDFYDFEDAFPYCNRIKEFIVHSENSEYSCDEFGVLFDKDKTTLIRYPRGNSRASYTVPETVKHISRYGFAQSTALEEINLPEKLETMGPYVFWDCINLKSIVIPDCIEYTYEYAFVGCRGLTSIHIPHQMIGLYGFSGVENLKDIYFAGTKDHWDKMGFGYIPEFKNVTVHFNENPTHYYKKHIYPNSCTEDGYIDYICNCGDSYRETIESTGHDFDGLNCTECGYNKTSDCICYCHRPFTLRGFFYIVKLLLFQRIFGINRQCSCGIAHY